MYARDNTRPRPLWTEALLPFQRLSHCVRPEAVSPRAMKRFPGQSKSGSSKINALIALITINVDVNCTYYSHLSSLVAVEVVEEGVESASSSDAFKLGLCQFTKDLFHYVAPFSDYEQCCQQILPPAGSQPHLSARDKFAANPFWLRFCENRAWGRFPALRLRSRQPCRAVYPFKKRRPGRCPAS